MTTHKRILKIQDIGDHYLKQVKPKIQLQGKWLLKAGLFPEEHVEILNPQPGVLVLRCLKVQE